MGSVLFPEKIFLTKTRKQHNSFNDINFQKKSSLQIVDCLFKKYFPVIRQFPKWTSCPHELYWTQLAVYIHIYLWIKLFLFH